MSVYGGPADWWTDGTDEGRRHLSTKGIVQSGLVLNLDAGVSSSYPGSGTTWSDLSGLGNNGTLVNGPTFTQPNPSRFNFDGTNDYLEVTNRNTNLEFQPTQPFSAFCWLYNLTYGSTSTILSNMFNTTPYPGWDIWKNGSDKIAMHLITSWNTNAIKVQITINYSNYSNRWLYLGYTYDGSCPANATASLNSVNFYIDGNLYENGKSNDIADGFDNNSQSITYNTSQRFRIGSRWASGAPSSQGIVNVGAAQIYNRALSATEIQQNFNALRGRFGI